MEVHHHSGSSPKKWTHYLWEFLMLFLAVFCGFLAENQRERIVEHEREKEFIRSLADDLNSDIEQSNATLIKLQDTRTATDSIVMLLASPGIEQNSNQVYRLWSTHFGYADFFENDRTIQQLKSSGALRLIRKKNVSDSIMNYDRVVKDYNGQDDLMSRVLSNTTPYYQFFDFISLDDPANLNKPVPFPAKGIAMMNEVYANRKIWSFALGALIKRLRVVNETAKRTLDLIRKEYHLDQR